MLHPSSKGPILTRDINPITSPSGDPVKCTAAKPRIIPFPRQQRLGDPPQRRFQRELIFTQVDTDSDIGGWGEVTTYPGAAGNRAIKGCGG